MSCQRTFSCTVSGRRGIVSQVSGPAPARRVYPVALAAKMLMVEPDSLRKRAERDSIRALKPGVPPNPLREWLIDADAVDKEAGATCLTPLWVSGVVAPSGAEAVEPSSIEPDRILADYRDQLDLAKSEAAVEREARWLAERRLLETERDMARRDMARLRSAFRAAAGALAEDSADSLPGQS